MLDTSAISLTGPISRPAPTRKFQKEQVAKAARVYSGQLRREVNAEREKLGKKPIEDEDDENHPVGVEAHRKPQKRLFPPQTRTAECSRKRRTRTAICIRMIQPEQARLCSWVLSPQKKYCAWHGTHMTRSQTDCEVKFVTMGCFATRPQDCQKNNAEDSRIPILPYTRYKGKKDTFKPWDFTYNVVNDSFVCPGRT